MYVPIVRLARGRDRDLRTPEPVAAPLSRQSAFEGATHCNYSFSLTKDKTPTGRTKMKWQKRHGLMNVVYYARKNPLVEHTRGHLAARTLRPDKLNRKKMIRS
jgi:hypothetical protein